jgi:hypothetical protein
MTRADEEQLIEFVEVDPGVFGSVLPAPPVEPDLPGGGHRTRSWLPGLGIAVMVLAAATVAWNLRPWHTPPQALVVHQEVVPITLTDHLVIGAPTVGPPTAFRPASSPDTPTNSADQLGAVFVGAKSATGYDYASVYIHAGTLTMNDPTMKTITIRGSTGGYIDQPPGAVLFWGPIDGLSYQMLVKGLDENAARRLAESIEVKGDDVVVDDRSLLDGLQPFGTARDVQRSTEPYYSLVFGSPVAESSVVLYKARPRAALAVGPAPGGRPLDLLRFASASFGAAEETATVHGHQAFVVAPMGGFGYTNADGSSIGGGTASDRVVVWTEGGRILAVAAGSRQEALRLAESVRPATDAEWAAVTKVTTDSQAVFPSR